jgi:hypothetical protein
MRPRMLGFGTMRTRVPRARSSSSMATLTLGSWAGGSSALGSRGSRTRWTMCSTLRTERPWAAAFCAKLALDFFGGKAKETRARGPWRSCGLRAAVVTSSGQPEEAKMFVIVAILASAASDFLVGEFEFAAQASKACRLQWG